MASRLADMLTEQFPHCHALEVNTVTTSHHVSLKVVRRVILKYLCDVS